MSESEYIQYDLLKLTEGSNELTIPNGYFNGENIASFKIYNNGVIKRIVIGDYCFENVRVFELDELSELESVVIGENGFWISSSERSDGDYRIVNCPKLKSIEIGDWCFNRAPSFSLTGLIDGLV